MNFLPFFIFIPPFLIYFFFSISSPLFKKKSISRIKTKDKILSLTFDDGPNGDFTLDLLEILKKYNVKATFFQVGENIEKFPGITKKAFAENHIIGNHLFTHSFLSCLSSSRLEKELIRTQKTIEKVIGKKPRFFRPPGLFGSLSLFKIVLKYNYLVVGGTFSSCFEQFQPNPSFMAWEVAKKIYPGIILIFHDGYNNKEANRKNTIRAVEKVIPKILEKGYKILPLSILLRVKPYQ